MRHVRKCLIFCSKCLQSQFFGLENQKVLSPDCFLPAFVGEISSDEDEWYWEQLAHVEEHALLEAFLHFLGVFDEEAEGEDEEDV